MDMNESDPPGRRRHAAADAVDDLACAAGADAAVLITGVPDADVRAVANTIHRRSRRALGPLMTIDCAAVPDAVLESQLFGAALSDGIDATGATRGFFEQADRGTMFLARVDALSLTLQSRLFEFLDCCEVRRAGAERAHARVDVRVIASAEDRLFNRAVGESFRQDLFYRLNTIHLVMPRRPV